MDGLELLDFDFDLRDRGSESDRLHERAIRNLTILELDRFEDNVVGGAELDTVLRGRTWFERCKNTAGMCRRRRARRGNGVDGGDGG